MRVNKKELQFALDASVKLQSFYAQLLNMYDGGERLEFKTTDEWLQRLRVMKISSTTNRGLTKQNKT